ncbi:MAG: hypothetical protein CVT88_00630 [Candidatus Altiarchaeales archaeon HGW-Altiarchaeales-1]|nr:MAG: hypothetical protein CVT88_00630 [Candidatus Altiarchaeales archaeon HGW-Altiarchaeales-1]
MRAKQTYLQAKQVSPERSNITVKTLDYKRYFQNRRDFENILKTISFQSLKMLVAFLNEGEANLFSLS